MGDKKILLLSVGGTLEQTVKSMEYNACEYIIFFCSKDTYPNVKEALSRYLAEPDASDKPEKRVKIKEYEKIVTENPEDIGRCFRVLKQNLPKTLDIWGMSYDDIVVDFTGGTKVMTASLALATIQDCNKYSYIGGEDRTKDGVGVVINGREMFCYNENPWRELAIGELKLVDTLFSKARYASTAEHLDKIRKSIDIRLKDVYDQLYEICNAYYEWDNFRHRQAKVKFERSFANLKKHVIDNRDFLSLVDQIEKNFLWLCWLNSELFNERKETDNAKGYRMLCIDLLSNAVRRAEKEQKYDDAVARLYSSVEKIVKSRLLEYGIDNSRTEKSQIPVELAAQFEKHRYYHEKEKKYFYKYGLHESCQVLQQFDADFDMLYRKNQNNLKQLMDIRNSSVLAHGTEPVSRNLYERMLQISLEFIGIEKEELVYFAEFNLNNWGGKLLG